MTLDEYTRNKMLHVNAQVAKQELRYIAGAMKGAITRNYKRKLRELKTKN
jgi:hypothetical protein